MSKEEKKIGLKDIRPITLSFFKQVNACLVPSSSGGGYYLVIPNYYCSCPDFISRAVLKKEKKFCYHLEEVGRILSGGKAFQGKPINTIKLLRKFLPWV